MRKWWFGAAIGADETTHHRVPVRPWHAALGMSFSSVTVISNANRPKRFRLQEVSA